MRFAVRQDIIIGPAATSPIFFFFFLLRSHPNNNVCLRGLPWRPPPQTHTHKTGEKAEVLGTTTPPPAGSGHTKAVDV